MAVSQYKNGKKQWEEDYRRAINEFGERKKNYTFSSGIEPKPLYDWNNLKGFDPEEQLSYPGIYPYTRGIHTGMYRTRLWTKRLLSGYGSPEDFNERAGDVHHSLVKFNNMLYALVQELRDEVTEYDLGWSRAEHGSITWGQWDNWHMHITINSDGNVNEYDEDGRCKNYPFENLGKPFMHDLFYLRDALEETFKVAKKLRVELNGKYM